MLEDEIFEVQDEPTMPQFAGSYPPAVDWQPDSARIAAKATSITVKSWTLRISDLEAVS
jgi:hypothetical protein